MIKYPATVLWLIGLILGSIHPADAQQLAKKVTRIGVLSPGSLPLGPLEAFRQTLRELGYIDGQNITIEWRFAEGKNDRLPELAEDLVRLKVDVIFVINTQAAQAAKKAAGTIPIVFARVSDPTRTGLVASLSRPGGNITGLSNVADELGGKRLELLKETLPHVSQVAVLWNSGNPGVALIVKEMEFASPRLNVQLHSVGMREPKDFLSASETLRKGRFGALFVLDDLLVTSYKREIMDLSQENRMPVISLYAEFVDIGGLMAYGPSIPDMYRRAAMYVDKILKGVKPAELPVEQPTKFELVINLNTARQIGLTVPPQVLARADRVIK
jgi:putative tryptophan/tyrosine transport system substrate-binding protein